MIIVQFKQFKTIPIITVLISRDIGERETRGKAPPPIFYRKGTQLRSLCLFSCRPHSLELNPRFYPGPDHQCRVLQTFA